MDNYIVFCLFVLFRTELWAILGQRPTSWVRTTAVKEFLEMFWREADFLIPTLFILVS